MSSIVQIESDLPCWNRRMFAQIFRAQQALFLGGHGGEQNRTPRPLRRHRVGVRHFQQDATAGRVVVGAVVDVVARHVGTNAEVIVVGGVHDGFGFQLRVGAGQHGNHVVRFERTDLADHMGLQLHRKRHGMKVPRARLRHHLVHVHARHGGQFFGSIKVNPGGDFQFRRTVQLQIGLLARI